MLRYNFIKKNIKKILFALAFLTTIIVSVFVYNLKHKTPSILTPSINNSITLSQSEQLIHGIPVRLSIPAINIDAAFENVGVTSAGAMDMPKNIEKIGWYDLGQRPGNIGSAVIAGHSGLKADKTEAFNDLYKLVKGDKIFIIDDMGNNIPFVVREIKSFDSLADTTDIFISNDGKSHLNLITCDGAWSNVTKRYSGRLVVFTDKE